MAVGDLRLFRLGAEDTARAVIEPARGFDCGGGAGKRVEREVRGGTVGVVLDARGRPLALPEDDALRKASVRQSVQALALYPDR